MVSSHRVSSGLPLTPTECNGNKMSCYSAEKWRGRNDSVDYIYGPLNIKSPDLKGMEPLKDNIPLSLSRLWKRETERDEEREVQ